MPIGIQPENTKPTSSLIYDTTRYKPLIILLKVISHHLPLPEIYVSKNIVGDLVTDKLVVVYAVRRGTSIRMFNTSEVVAFNQKL